MLEKGGKQWIGEDAGQCSISEAKEWMLEEGWSISNIKLDENWDAFPGFSDMKSFCETLKKRKHIWVNEYM